MTDRPRNLFVLLLVAGLLVASLAVIATKPTRLGLDLKGGVSLIYQAKPTKQSAVTGDAIDRSLDIMRKRVDQIGVAEPSLQRSGADQIDVSLPDVKNADDPVGTVLEWGVRALNKPVEVNAEGDLPARATADLFPAYDDDGGMLLVLTPAK
jgi:preprotein translocase subunit SecD